MKFMDKISEVFTENQNKIESLLNDIAQEADDETCLELDLMTISIAVEELIQEVECEIREHLYETKLCPNCLKTVTMC